MRSVPCRASLPELGDEGGILLAGAGLASQMALQGSNRVMDGLPAARGSWFRHGRDWSVGQVFSNSCDDNAGKHRWEEGVTRVPSL